MKKIAFFSLLFFTQIAYAQFDYGVDVKKEEPKPPVYDGLSNIEANFHQITFDYKHLNNEEVVYIGITDKTDFYEIVSNKVNYSQSIDRNKLKGKTFIIYDSGQSGLCLKEKTTQKTIFASASSDELNIDFICMKFYNNAKNYFPGKVFRMRRYDGIHQYRDYETRKIIDDPRNVDLKCIEVIVDTVNYSRLFPEDFVGDASAYCCRVALVLETPQHKKILTHAERAHTLEAPRHKGDYSWGPCLQEKSEFLKLTPQQIKEDRRVLGRYTSY